MADAERAVGRPKRIALEPVAEPEEAGPLRASGGSRGRARIPPTPSVYQARRRRSAAAAVRVGLVVLGRAEPLGLDPEHDEQQREPRTRRDA